MNKCEKNTTNYVTKYLSLINKRGAVVILWSYWGRGSRLLSVCWGIRWVLTHFVRVCLKIDFIFLTVFCNFHSFTHCAWTCWKNKVFMKMWKIQQFGPWSIDQKFWTMICNILVFLLSKYFINLPGWLYYNYGYYCVCLLGWFIKIKEHENVYHVNQKCCTTTFVSESLFHKLQNKIVNNIEITIKSTQWRPHADHTSHLVVC